MSINILDDKTISLIAAGEVIERPASVVKELVENSLDAGASQIDVEVTGSGINSIRVSDNGAGISGNDIDFVFCRHATSKLISSDDLESISSLGFRGEALPSIAAVAQVELTTCSGEENGFYITLENGFITDRGNLARSKGTTVTVKNLFRKLPARLKFLKSRNTENSQIANVVSQYALAYPQVTFSLLIDGRKTLKTPGNGRLIDVITVLYGTEVANSMLELKPESKEINNETRYLPVITGLVGAPTISRTSRNCLSFFVNNRWVSNRILTKSVTDAYHGLLMQGKYPVSIINISMPFSEVDVNVHPAKTEVKFRNDQIVFKAVYKTVHQTLINQMKIPEIRRVVPIATVEAKQESLSFNEPNNYSDSSSVTKLRTELDRLPVLRVLGQLSNNYIITEGPDGLYLIDQHAAHERIIFDEYKKQKLSQQIDFQYLLEPEIFTVEPRNDEFIKSYHQDLAEFGFSIEHFGDRTYLIRAIPSMLRNKDWVAALRELLDSLNTLEHNHWLEEIALSIACHSAILAGQKLSEDEMYALIRQLEKSDNPRTCPHGRPIMIHLSSGQLEKEFGRT